MTVNFILTIVDLTVNLKSGSVKPLEQQIKLEWPHYVFRIKFVYCEGK